MPSEMDLITMPSDDAVKEMLTDLNGGIAPTDQQLSIAKVNLAEAKDGVIVLSELILVEQTLTEIGMIATVTFGRMLTQVLIPYKSRLEEWHNRLVKDFNALIPSSQAQIAHMYNQTVRKGDEYLKAVEKALISRDGGAKLRKIAVEPYPHLVALREAYRPGTRKPLGEVQTFVARRIIQLQNELGISIPRAIEMLDGQLRYDGKTELTKKVIAWLDGDRKAVAKKVRQAIVRYVPPLD